MSFHFLRVVAAVLLVPILVATPTDSTVSARPSTSATADHDWNRDGFGDVMGIDASGRLWSYQSDGAGGFSARRQLGTGWLGYDQVRPVGDFNNDGIIDIIARKISTAELFLYPGNGSGGFQSRERIGTGWNGMSHVFSPGDWTGDGVNDILATKVSNGAIYVYRGRGDGGVFSGVRTGSGWRSIVSVIPTGDFDDNGAIDFLGRDTRGRLRLFNGNGSGGFARVQYVGSGFGDFTSALGVGDFSGDGHPDLLGERSNGELLLFSGNGSGGWTRPYPVIGTGWSGIRFPDESTAVGQPPSVDSSPTDPPVTSPPSTDPPVTSPPSTDPPVTSPPSTDPPVTSPPSTDPPTGGPGVFLETFDGDPSSPTVFSSERWDIRRNITDYQLWEVGQSVDGQHGPDCAGPPATHRIDNWMTEGVYMCKNHMMTAMDADSYGITTLTPDAQVDFSTAGTVSFDLSTLVMSGRDWVDVWITPADDVLALACGGKCPAYNGTPRNTIHAEKDGNRWVIKVIRDFQTVGSIDFYEVGEPSARIRTRFELSLTPSGVQFGTPDDGRFVEIDESPGFTSGIVQWAQHSYNPFKDNSGVAATWHWDNFRIEPAVPLNMIQSDDERLVGTPGDVLTTTFAAPAPAGARMMFNGVCRISLDFGSGFTEVTQVPGSAPGPPETSHSYFVPVPTGADSVSVRFAGDGWYDGFPCLFEDPVILVP